MIKTFRCKETQKIWNGEWSGKFPVDIQERALVKLRQLDVARTTHDLRIPPSNHLEMLKGSRIGQMSIRISKQWRLCFVWEREGAYDVEIIDYH